MIYKKFRIKNFKGIDEVIIDLANSRILTLVGLNESGKTTIMEGVDLFYKMIKGDEPKEDDLNVFRPKGTDFSNNIEIEAWLILEKDDKEKIHKLWREKGKKTKLEIPNEFSYAFKFSYDLHKYKKTQRTCSFDIKTKTSQYVLYQTNTNAWQELVNYIKKEIVPEILYYDDFIFEIPETIHFIKTGQPESTDATQKNNLIWQSVINDILKSVNEKFTFQEHVVDIYDTDNDSAINRISKMEQVLDRKITSRWSELFGDNKINFKEIKLESKFSNGNFDLSFKIKTESGKVFSVRERSKGFKWFFSFLLFTEFRKKRTKNILFLLDEPASNLHSSAQAKILDAIDELSNDSLVIYSTHSHHLINPKWLSGSYICINENLSEDDFAGNFNIEEGAKITAIKYFTYVGNGQGDDKFSYFQPILDRLDYQPSTVEPIPKITIFEGKNDWYTMKYFKEVILKDSDEYHFYPGAGCNKLWEIIRLYLSWGETFLVVLDGDKPGIEAKEYYIKEFDEFFKDRIFTLKDILGINDYMEALIEEEDKKTIYETVYGKNTFDTIKNKKSTLKKKLNTAIIKLLMDEKSISISKHTKDNFKNLLKFIKDNM